MKSSALYLAIPAVILIAAASFFVANRNSSHAAPRAPQTADFPRVEAGETTADGKETFHVLVAEPWPGAGRRVVLLTSASVTDSALAALGLRSTTDAGLGSDALTLDGERFRCTVKSRTDSWQTVKAQGDLEITLTPMPH